MYLIFVMAVYFTIRDVQLVGGAIRKMKQKRKKTFPVLQQPKEEES